MLRKITYLLAVLLATTCSGGWGDVLHLNQGDALSGRLVRIAEGVLVYRTALSGQMMVPMSQVKGLETDRNLVIAMEGDTVRYGRIVGLDGSPHVLPLSGGEAEPITLAQVQEAMILPSTPEEKTRWDKRLSTGLRGRITNEDALDGYARLELLRREGGPELDVMLDVEGGRDGVDVEGFEGSLSVRSGKRTQLRPYMSLSISEDSQRYLDLEGQLSLGLGRYWMEGDADQSLYTGIGLLVEEERWERHGLDHSGDTLHLELQLRYARMLGAQGEMENRLTLLPGLSDWDAFEAESNTTFTYPVSSRLKLRLDVALGYDNHPGFSSIDRWNAGFGAGVQFDF